MTDENYLMKKPSASKGDASCPSTANIAYSPRMADTHANRTIFIGREHEVALLEESFNKVKTNPPPVKQIAFVSGMSGSGKSCLVNHVFQEKHSDYFLCRGKFDQLRRGAPYAAVLDALSVFCDGLTEEADIAKTHECLSERLNSELKSRELQVLRELFPGSRVFRGGSQEKETNESLQYLSSRGIQISTSLRSLIRVVATQDRPLVFILDDIQWCDDASYEFLHLLAIDEKVSGLLMIITFREKDKRVVSLLDSIKEGNPFCIEVLLSNLSRDDVHSFVSESLMTKPSNMEDLVEFLFTRSKGNMLSAQQMLKLLFVKGYVEYRVDEHSVDMDAIKADSTFDNCRHTAQELLHGLPHKTHEFLRIASFLGATFSAKVAGFLFCNLEEMDSSISTIKDDEALACESIFDIDGGVTSIIENAVENGFIEHRFGSHYSFCHDSFQKVLLSAEGTHGNLHRRFRMGKLLYHLAQQKGTNALGLQTLAVTELNACSSLLTHEDDLAFLAQLNLAVSNSFAQKSAFSLALTFVESGLSHIEPFNMWENYYKLALELTNKYAELSCCCGRLKACRMATRTIERNAREVDDTFASRQVEAIALAGGTEPRELLFRTKSLLRDLGISIRFNLPTMIWSVVKLKNALKSMTDDELIFCPSEKEDKLKLQALALISNVVTTIFLNERYTEYTILAYLRLDICMHYGGQREIAAAYSGLGTVLGAMKDYEGAFRLGQMSLQTSEEWGCYNPCEWMTHLILRHWKRPLHESFEPLLNSYQVGMQRGCTQDAYWAILSYCCLYFHSGLPLGPLHADTAGHIHDMHHFGQVFIRRVMLPYVQLQELLIESNDYTKLEGSFIEDLGDFIAKCKESRNYLGLNSVNFCKMMLLYLFGNYDQALKVANRLGGKAMKREGATFSCCAMTFFKGLVYFAVSSRQRQLSAKREARYCMRQLQDWVRVGNVNCVHMMKILEAEDLALRGKDWSTVKQAFDGAIRVANRSGFVHHSGIANVRAGKWCLLAKRGAEANCYFESAAALFDEWNAPGLAQFCRNEVLVCADDLLSATFKSSSGRRVSVRGRSRYDSSIIARYRTSSREIDILDCGEDF